MLFDLVKKLVGTKNDRELKRIQFYVDQVNRLEKSIRTLGDKDLKIKTSEFKQKLERVEIYLRKIMT